MLMQFFYRISLWISGKFWNSDNGKCPFEVIKSDKSTLIWDKVVASRTHENIQVIHLARS